MFKLSIETDKGPISVLIEDEEAYLRYSGYQRGSARPIYRNPDWPIILNKSWEANFNKIQKLGAFDLPDNPKIVDVGTGVGTLPLLLSKYLNNPTFFLIDKSLTQVVVEFQSANNTHGFYNSWDPLISSISVNNLDRHMFSMNNVDDEWPGDVDLIISTWSWCWHYPKSAYWRQAISSLKPFGKLQLDVSNWPNVYRI
jgi:SAM-dependent methyltransferase